MPSFFSKVFSGGVADVVDSLGNVADKFITTKEEKEQFKAEAQIRLMQIESQLEETYRTELQERRAIIEAEMAQGDNYTKRARPTIVYAGLAFVCIIHVILPVIAFIADADKMPDIKLPDEFWWAWGTVVSVYGVGRSAEKMGVTNKITELATGSGADRVRRAKTIEG
ncbi:holin family protein [Flammeovirgaceae bacterium SG7u.111]|nr:holin family protein [Flammeovirgaceae bacterium SG7u.132]WPO36494.1 holin family protein [Flammeovirgaceae bacterium SG7u.111]